MGLLIDIRNGRRVVSGLGAIIFWLAAGAALGFGETGLFPNSLPESTAYVPVLVSGALGCLIGFYAAWGTSTLARVLAIPGVVVDILSVLAR